MAEKQQQTLEQLVLKLAEQNIINYTLKTSQDTDDILEEGEKWTFDSPYGGDIEIFHRPGMGGAAGVRFRLSNDTWKAVEHQHQTQAQQFYEAKTDKTIAEKLNDATKRLKPATLESVTHDIIARNLVQYEETALVDTDPEYKEIAYTFRDPENHDMRIYHRPGYGGHPVVEFRGSQEFTDKIRKLTETQRARFNAAMRGQHE